MPRIGGYLEIVDPDLGTFRADTITCFHCQRIVHFQTRAQFSERTGGCSVCGKVICLQCVEDGTCKPWEAQMEAAEARERFLRSAGLNG